MKRTHLVKLAKLAVKYWEGGTQQSKIHLEKRGGFRARTFERHLSVKTLPKSPQWDKVIQTAEFVLDNCPEQRTLRPSLEEQLSFLKVNLSS